MACGKVVLITKTKGLFDNKILKNMENIVLLDKDNVQSNINIIKKILNNNKLRSKIGLSAQKQL